jgi:hypothetical protein
VNPARVIGWQSLRDEVAIRYRRYLLGQATMQEVEHAARDYQHAVAKYFLARRIRRRAPSVATIIRLLT